MPVRAFIVAALVLGASAAGRAGQDPPLIVVQRAAAYIADYQQKLSMVVAQERYDQEVRYPSFNARGRDLVQRTVLVSDFLLVRGREGMWLPFRDVFEQDDKPVRDREERLSALFLADSSSAVEQARRIAEESSRYNIGNINRTVNVPTLPLEFLTDGQRARFSFQYEGGQVNGVRVIRYQEERGPTFIKTTNDRDLPVSGRYWIHVETGRVERTELKASDEELDAHITVTYRPDELAGLWVPQKMEEEYAQKNDNSEIRGTAVYSKFRRFQITTSDELAK